MEQNEILSTSQSPNEIESQPLLTEYPLETNANRILRKTSNDTHSVRNSETSPLLRSSSTRAIKKGRMSTLVGIMYASLGGMVASITLILTKSGVEVLLKQMFDNNNQFHGAFAFTLLSVLVVSAIVQVLVV